MIQASDFRLFSVQTVAFTPDTSQFRAAKVMASVISKFAERYNGEITSDPLRLRLNLPLPGGSNVQIDMRPVVSLSSEDKRWTLAATPERVDSFWFAQSEDESANLKDICQQCLEPLLTYVTSPDVQIGRLALVVRHQMPHADPANALAQMFCQPAKVDETNEKAPLRHAAEFQLHNLKNYQSSVAGITVNSWFRCFGEARTDPPVIRLEQDINTLAEEMNARAFHADEIKEFFDKVPDEMNQILNLYFPFGNEK